MEPAKSRNVELSCALCGSRRHGASGIILSRSRKAMPLLIYVVVVSAALLAGLFALPQQATSSSTSGSVRFGVAATHVPTTTAEMTARARENAEAIRIASELAQRQAKAAEDKVAAADSKVAPVASREASARQRKPKQRSHSFIRTARRDMPAVALLSRGSSDRPW